MMVLSMSCHSTHSLPLDCFVRCNSISSGDAELPSQYSNPSHTRILLFVPDEFHKPIFSGVLRITSSIRLYCSLGIWLQVASMHLLSSGNQFCSYAGNLKTSFIQPILLLSMILSLVWPLDLAQFVEIVGVMQSFWLSVCLDSYEWVENDGCEEATWMNCQGKLSFLLLRWHSYLGPSSISLHLLPQSKELCAAFVVCIPCTVCSFSIVLYNKGK